MPRLRKINDSQRARVLEVARVRQQLPSDKELAAESGVSISAIRKLMNELLEESEYEEMRASPAYQSWRSMMTRCFNQNYDRYSDYGGRGITVCERWQTFANFLEDMGERPEGHTLDRINNDGNYEPQNCQWATLSEQARNRRKARRKCKYLHLTSI